MLTDTRYIHCNPEIWAGIECTINRVQDKYKDQLDCSGHYTRPDDIDAFAKLGIKALRYPVLWEMHQSRADAPIDWSWTAQQLDKIRKNNITVIAGLLHHGSGPAFTDLTDPDFPFKLTAYAKQVATRFPWLDHYTPVNEPLTTARFSGLYGLWYPHHRTDSSFARMLINQLKAVVLCMKEIRKINPAARLVQTEDLGKTHSTALLAYQASFENERRWLTNDLLCGMVNRKHRLWKYLLSAAVPKKDLQFFLDHPCPPDIMGFNYYVTSERYLDEAIQKYPSCNRGGNGKHIYADTEAVRTGNAAGIATLLKEAWHRYHLPLAVTESHLSCSREEQMRWLKETWDECSSLKASGVDLRAVTAWSLLGAYDWDSLLTLDRGKYETGVFAVRNEKINTTALAKMITAFATEGKFGHPLLEQKGWWHSKESSSIKTQAPSMPVLIIGRNGTLGNAFTRICKRRGIHHIALTRAEIDISKQGAVENAIEHYKLWAIINAAGYVRVDEAENNQAECFAINATGPAHLAAACRRHGIKLMTFSSDLVFDGCSKIPYIEKDATSPLNVYGKSKELGERLVLEADPDALIIRTSSFFGPWDKYNFAYNLIESLKNSRPFHVLNDVVMSPTYVPDLVDASLDLFIDDEKGIYHLCNNAVMSWAEFAVRIAEQGGFKKNKLVYRTLSEMGWKAARPAYSALQNSHGILLPSIDSAVNSFFDQKVV